MSKYYTIQYILLYNAYTVDYTCTYMVIATFRGTVCSVSRVCCIFSLGQCQFVRDYSLVFPLGEKNPI